LIHVSKTAELPVGEIAIAYAWPGWYQKEAHVNEMRRLLKSCPKAAPSSAWSLSDGPDLTGRGDFG